tara:strand:- start:719 stop:916 length:198 start_codon:yes stop_codon:yes gene_type:complete
MATLTHKRHYRVTLDLEIIDDSHPRDFNWANMLEISCDEGVSLVRVDELDEDGEVFLDDSDSHMW